MRYEIKVGRFGAYFYDNELERDVDMNEALKILNEWSNLMNLGDKLGGPQR